MGSLARKTSLDRQATYVIGPIYSSLWTGISRAAEAIGHALVTERFQPGRLGLKRWPRKVLGPAPNLTTNRPRQRGLRKASSPRRIRPRLFLREITLGSGPVDERIFAADFMGRGRFISVEIRRVFSQIRALGFSPAGDSASPGKNTHEPAQCASLPETIP